MSSTSAQAGHTFATFSGLRASQNNPCALIIIIIQRLISLLLAKCDAGLMKALTRARGKTLLNGGIVRLVGGRRKAGPIVGLSSSQGYMKAS